MCRRPCKEVTLRVLDVGLLQAGASMKGEFENRLRQVIDEVQSSPKPIILFIDEAHTLIGAGGAAGTGDAANLLKAALARGKLRTIAATTWAEYKKHIEKDPALTRRFQVVQVGEPSEEKTMLMMRGMASTMEQHHRVQILDEALEAAVKLSHRYIPARQLPDKAVSLLDTASARVAISLHAVPAAVEDCRRRIEGLEDRARNHRPRNGCRHRYSPAPDRRYRRSCRPRKHGWRNWTPAGRKKRAWSIRFWSCAPDCVAVRVVRWKPGRLPNLIAERQAQLAELQGICR
jgi:ATP-dependent Clp protease ATP-binding subunit ClpA